MPDPDFDLSRLRATAIVNPGSGSKDAPEIEALLRAALEPRVAALDIRRCAEGGRLPGLARAAVREGAGLVLASGGDGTQAAVAGALAGSEVVMAVIPGGTFNYFARNIGAGETAEAAIDTILTGHPQRIDIGVIDERVFLNNVSFGIYPEILETREGVYSRWGRSRVAAYWSVLLALRNLRHPLRLTAHVAGEERHFETALAFVARNARQLEIFGLEGAEAVRAGNLAVLVAHATDAAGIMKGAFRMALGMSAEGSDFDLIETPELTVETRPARQYVACDGERVRMTGPFHLAVRHGALRVMVPREGPPGPDDGDAAA